MCWGYWLVGGINRRIRRRNWVWIGRREREEKGSFDFFFEVVSVIF